MTCQVIVMTTTQSYGILS